jgi:hypothetical protein
VQGTSRAPLLAAVALGVIVVGGGVAALASGAFSSERAPGDGDRGAAAGSGAVAPVVPAVPAGPGGAGIAAAGAAAGASGVGAQAERKVHIEITTEPANAEIFIDGRRRFNPYIADLAYNPELRTLEVRAEGYKTLMMDLDLTEDQRLPVVLERGTGTSDQRRGPRRAGGSGGSAGGAAQPAGGTGGTSTAGAAGGAGSAGDAAGGGQDHPSGGEAAPRVERPRAPAPAPSDPPPQVARPPEPEPPPPNPDVVAPPPRRGFKNLGGI